MGYTAYPVNDALAVKLWSRTLEHEALKFTDIGPLLGTNANAIIQQKTETQKGPGDQITFGIRMQLNGAGFSENDLAEGNGEQLTTYNDALLINELGHVVGVKSRYTIDQQRVPFNLREEARDGLADWWAKRYSVAFFNQVCGYTPQNDVRYTGLNAVTAPSAGRIVRQNNKASDDLLVAGDEFTLDLLDTVKLQATTATPPIRPVKVGGGGDRMRRDFNYTLTDKFVCMLHPNQIQQIRRNTSTGQWFDIERAALMGGKGTNSPIYTGAMGEYNGIILRQAVDVTNGVSAAGADVPTAKRAVFLGGQSAIMAFGQDNGPTKYRWNEELFDHKRKLEVSAWSIYGLKKTRFNAVDYGCFVISSFS